MSNRNTAFPLDPVLADMDEDNGNGTSVDVDIDGIDPAGSGASTPYMSAGDQGSEERATTPTADVSANSEAGDPWLQVQVDTNTTATPYSSYQDLGPDQGGVASQATVERSPTRAAAATNAGGSLHVEPRPSGYTNIVPTSLPFLAPMSPILPEPDFEQLDTEGAVDMYLNHCHPMYPILRPDALRAALRTPNNDSSTGALLLSIVGLGAAQKTIGHPPNVIERAVVYLDVFTSRLSPPDLSRVDVEAVMTRFHIFLAYTAIGEKPRAWSFLQEAINYVLASIGGAWASFEEEIQAYRLYSVLFMAERMAVMFELHPSWYTQPLRLTDWTFTQTPFTERVFAPHLLFDWPLPELRLASLLRASQVQCWKGTCGGVRCLMWQSHHAADVMDLLDTEFSSALQKLARGPEEGTAHRANFVVTVAWFRNHLWSIFNRHGLVLHSQLLTMQRIAAQLTSVSVFCRGADQDSFDVALDWRVKLDDMRASSSDLLQTLDPLTRPYEVLARAVVHLQQTLSGL